MTCSHSRRDVSIATSSRRARTSCSFSFVRSMILIAYSIEGGDDDDEVDGEVEDEEVEVEGGDDDRVRCLPDRTTENAPFPSLGV